MTDSPHVRGAPAKPRRPGYVTTVRHGNVLFENDGTGAFEDITESSGLGYSGHSSSAVFFDYDRDGLLDLFLTNVGQYTTEDEIEVTWLSATGTQVVAGPIETNQVFTVTEQ